MNDESKALLAKYEPKELGVITADPQVVAARFSPCGKFVVAGGFDSRVRRWDLASEGYPELASLGGHGGWVEATAFYGDTLFSADTWGKLCAWSYADEKPEPTWEIENAHDGWIRQLAVSPDGALVASCSRDQRVVIWSTADGHKLQEFSEIDDVFCLKFHPGGNDIITGDAKGKVKQRNLANGQPLREFDASSLFLLHRLQDVGGVRVLAFDQEGKTLAVGGTKPKNGGTVQGVPTVLLFDFENGEIRHTLELGATSDCFVHDIRLHEDGFVMAVTSGTPGTGKIIFQRTEDKEPFYQSTKIANCHSLSLHPDGQRLAVAATNKGSNGNGRRLTEEGEYTGNHSPIHLFQLGGESTEAAAG